MQRVAAVVPRVAQAVIAIVTIGFFFGGFVGIMTSELPTSRRVVPLLLLAALLVLHLRNCVRRLDGGRPAAWQLTLAAQAVLTFVPMIWYSSTWYGNVGFLCGAVLLLVRPGWLAWAGFGAVLAADLPLSLAERPTVAEALYFLIGQAAFVGVAVYGMARLADLVAALEETLQALPAARVTQERLAFTRRLQENIGVALAGTIERGEHALTLIGERPDEARDLLDDGVRGARAALATTRRVAHEYLARLDDPAEPARARTVAGDLTTRTVAVLGAATLGLMIVPYPLRFLARGDHAVGSAALFVLLLAAYIVLYVYGCLRAYGRPLGAVQRYGVLGGLVVLTFAPMPFYGPTTWAVLPFLPGAAAALLGRRLRWPVVAVLVCQDVPFGIWGTAHWGTVYFMVWTAERAALVYGIARMAGFTATLQDAREETAAAAVVGERLRFSRDLHDLLGYSLSTVVVKNEVAARLATARPDEARRQLAEALGMSRQALADMTGVTSGYREMSVAAEAGAARATLAAVGIEVAHAVDVPDLPADLDTVLATVLREGVTNILRHSRATRCSIEAAVIDGVARLRLTNDGVDGPPAPDPERAAQGGIGLPSLAERVAARGGVLTAERTGGGFVLGVETPVRAERPAEAATR
ncbi:sensor histidine kinase [Actinomadura napierensis]|uniref:Signal transduction histidine kinase subgroup 3 dimerisation and phosphoacceptor domain-containing protein n=1 Tax=Actinomadura napierensis TaxID=267854 RepID=A0ABN3AGK4_9ACTN